MNNFIRFSCALAAVTTFSLPAVEAAIVENYNFPALGLAIADGNPAGLANTQAITTSSISDILSLTVTMEVSGTFNGDLYAYLVHGSGFSVLLNRVGRDAGNLFGSSDDGLMVTFDDLATSNIHDYQSVTTPGFGAQLMGAWQPDGRAIDPDLVLDTDAPTAMLSSFGGEDTNGDWTLFIADLSSGESHTLEGWGMTVTGIPEPSGLALVGISLVGLLLRRHR